MKVTDITVDRQERSNNTTLAIVTLHLDHKLYGISAITWEIPIAADFPEVAHNFIRAASASLNTYNSLPEQSGE